MVVGFRTTYAISKVVSSIPGLHSIQHYVIYMSVTGHWFSQGIHVKRLKIPKG